VQLSAKVEKSISLFIHAGFMHFLNEMRDRKKMPFLVPKTNALSS